MMCGRNDDPTELDLWLTNHDRAVRLAEELGNRGTMRRPLAHASVAADDAGLHGYRELHPPTTHRSPTDPPTRRKRMSEPYPGWAAAAAAFGPWIIVIMALACVVLAGYAIWRDWR